MNNNIVKVKKYTDKNRKKSRLELRVNRFSELKGFTYRGDRIGHVKAHFKHYEELNNQLIYLLNILKDEKRKKNLKLARIFNNYKAQDEEEHLLLECQSNIITHINTKLFIYLKNINLDNEFYRIIENDLPITTFKKLEDTYKFYVKYKNEKQNKENAK